MTATLTAERPHVASEWPAMGTRARARLVGGTSADLCDARALVEDRERRWSRFRSDSELSGINAAAGRAVLVSTDTAALVAEALAWSEATGGRFDPTVLGAVRAAGYVRSFDRGPGPTGDGRPVLGHACVHVDTTIGAVAVAAGAELDLGGIGKGATADRVADLLVDRTLGGLIDLGGDLRVWGEPPEGNGWSIAVEDVRNGSEVALLWLARGAVATSTVLRRRWSDGVHVAHHLIDPATGRPVQGDLVAVTVTAARATGAEVLAKAALITGTTDAAIELLDAHGVAALLFPADGDPVPVGGWTALCHPGVR